jgi:subtilisin-like proprotein convertase family protein
MKKLLLLTGLLICVLSVTAQVSESDKNLAMDLVRNNSSHIGLLPGDQANSIIEHTYIIPGTDIRMVYLQQSYKGIPVYNQLHVLAFRNGKLVSSAGSRIASIEQRLQNPSSIPAITAVDAIQTSIAETKLSTAEPITALTTRNDGRKTVYGKLGVSAEEITTELLWFPDEETGEAKLVWQVFIAPKNSTAYWLMRVDAFTNTIISKENLTVTCNWDKEDHSVGEHFEKHVPEKQQQNYVLDVDRKNNKWRYKGWVVNNATYRVIKYPAESPIHPGGNHQLHTNPWTWAPGNATTLGWHFDGVQYFDSTRGNNAFAYEDRNNNNLPDGYAALSLTPQPDLSFDFTPDYTLEPTVRVPAPNQQFNTTNLFYWNNLMHDLTYLYGFTEAARNFQEDNMGRGGLGSDYVNAEAQDGSGSNNANFATGADGANPRMQMYLWTAPNPDRDGDVDNGIICHEYAHGISNRLTATGSGCLGNAEQMGEGWSDYFALMYTHDWPAANPGQGFNNPRGVGTYALNQPPNGVGIRQFPYTTNMAVNPMTYANLPTVVHPHGTGTIWCTMLWEMTWEIIQEASINPNLFNVTPITGGNNVALKLVVEGMRLQPCSPGFQDGRDAILRADTLLFGGQYSCAIWRAFAKRGLGFSASQGLSSSRTDGIVAFDTPVRFTLNPGSTTIPEGASLTITARPNATCEAMNNFIVRDTLPPSVTYQSSTGGTLAGNVVTFNPVTLASGATGAFAVTVGVNPGTFFPPQTFINDAATSISPNFVTTAAPNDWVVSATQSHSAPSSFFASELAAVSDKILTSTGNFPLAVSTASRTVLTFWHWYNTQANFDGGVIEVSTNGGGAWTNVTDNMFLQNGYNSTLGAGGPLAGFRAFSGNSGGFRETKLDLSSFAGQSIMIRFRFGTNATIAGSGWFVDDILLENKPQVYVKAGLYNASNALRLVRDTVVDIVSGVCIPPVVTSHPASVVRCSTPGNAVFTMTNSNFGSYQWQISTNGGVNWSNIAGANTATYTIVNPTSALNGNLYRAIVSATCGEDTTDAAILYVSPTLTHSATSVTPPAICAPGAAAVTGTAGGGTTANALIGSTGQINLPITDNDPAGINSTIKLPALSFPAASNLKLRVNIDNHTWVGDLKITLTSPCGTTFVFDRPGVPASIAGNSDNLNGVYIFDINAAAIIPETSVGGVILAGTYQPSNDANPGVAHNWTGVTFPCSAAGNWVLNVADLNGSDVGTLVDWGIFIAGNYTHSLTGPGTIIQNAPTGPNNATGNFSVSAVPAGVQNYTLTSTDILGCTVSSNLVFTVNSVATITTQPVNRIICDGGNTTFNIIVNSVTPPSYQWETSTNGGGIWTPLTNTPPFSGVNTATLTLTNVSTAYNGHMFRVQILNACGNQTSAEVTLTVNPLPTISAGPTGLCAPQTLTATGNSNTYTWSPATGLNTTTGPVVIANPTVTTTYTVTGTITATGCTNTATVTVLGNPPTPVITPSAPVICAGQIVGLTVQQSSSFSGGSITIPAGAPTTTSGVAAPYPATINVSGLPTSGMIVKSITLNGMNHTFPGDIDMVLQSPTSTNVILMSDVGGGNDIVNGTITFDDAAATGLPGTIISGTYRPTNTAGPDNFPAPGPGSITNINPTLATFTGNFNGVWNLYINDQAGGDVGNITSWSITFAVSPIATAIWTPVTGLFSNPAGTIPYVAGTPATTVYASPAVTTTYTVTNVAGACSSGPSTVTVTVNPLPTVSVAPNNQCGPVTLTATGNSNTYTWSPAAGLNTTTGATVIANPQLNTTYTVTGTITATGCSNTATATVNATPATPTITPSSVSICRDQTIMLTANPVTATTANGGQIIIPAGAPTTTSGIANPYPGTIDAGGLPVGGVRVKSVQINGFSHTFPGDVDVVLQSPTGQNVILFSDHGGGTDAINANLVFDDAAATTLPAAIVSGTYRPTNAAGPDNFPAPGPGSITNINPTLSTFTGDLNGSWKLFVNDQAGGDVGVISSWSITFEINGANWSPVTGLFLDPAATVPYVAGTYASPVYAKPTTTTTYSVTRSNGSCASTAGSVTVTVFIPIAITTQPTNQTVCQGANATFSVVTTGNFQSYQWQVSTVTPAVFTNIPGANSATLTLTAVTAAMNGYQYRVVVTNTCTTVTSNVATLTVNALPTVVATDLFNMRVCLTDTLVPLVGTPTGGNWTGVGVSGFNFVPTATAVGTYILTYSYTSAAGCTRTDTTSIKVIDCPERIRLLRNDAVILYPNPNNGNFNIRINSTLYNYLGVSVYNSAGALVRTMKFGGLVYGRIIPIDLSYLPSSTYMVKFYYDDGIRTSEKTFKVVVSRD